ncbi:hypothetical protein FH972_017763 [Carpinus fangiana]|uniref:Uncharacterized protein n=1 Tax=Carpinus fangiana TaxID=176857 RepID=A0A5N6RNT7_9ROSI|nr:hypothetical protein FH972_017763 [Carpinus fangiana]
MKDLHPRKLLTSKVEVAFTTLLKRTKEKSHPGVELEAHVGDVVLDEEGNDQMLTDLFKDGQNPFEAPADAIAPVPHTAPVDPMLHDDDETEDSE